MMATESGTELSRTLRPRHLTMISIGGIIGAGLFVGSSAAIAAAGPAIVLSYLLAGVLIFLVMRMIGEMATMHPGQRAFTELARLGLGRWAGFTAGWLYWYFWMIVVPIEAIAGANILQAWIPLPAWQIGLLLMAMMTAVNLMSARSYGEFEFWFASIKVAAIVVFIVMATAFAFGWLGPQAPGFDNLTAHQGFMPFGFLAVLGGAAAVFFSITGAEIITVAAAESSQPAKAVADMTTSVVVRILIFYVLSVLLIVMVVPWTEVRVGESPFTLALSRMNVGWAGIAMSAVILTAVLSCLNSAFYVCSRVLLVLAEQGDAPQWLVQVNERRVPTRSVWIAAVAGVIGVLAATVSAQGVFAFLVNSSGAVILFVYIITAAAQIRMRRAHDASGLPTPAVRMWLFPWASYVAIAGMLAVLAAMATTPARAAELRTSLVALVVALICYGLRARQQGRLSYDRR
ncbi:amino acid permease [Steroidobacter sp.]|uniref:amino acid permease n=1 Tax=Steroidobacter sp. TaxID=1978227 RepID=UPI001A50EBCF|nr:amino acid permease [Steroidobacter sp.]MBL8268486.1 amino acid permease [Steroidobacter sp.]